MTLTNPAFLREKTVADLEASLVGAWKWWIGELSACVPPALRQRFAAGRRRLLLIVDAAGDNLIQETSSGRRPLGRIDFDTPGDRGIFASVPQVGKGDSAPVAIRLDARHALRTAASLPLAAERNLAQVVGFEFERLVPFKRNDVYYAYRVTARDKTAQTLGIELTVVPHAELAKAMEALAHLGLQPAEIQVGDENADALLTTIAVASGNRIDRGQGSHRVVLGLGIAAALLAIACLAIPLWRADATIATLNAQIASARRQAEASAGLQKQIVAESRDQQFLVGRKRANPTVTELLATLTRLLSDDTYLTELDVKGDEIRLVGVTGSATALLALIDKSPSFRDASFQSSITQDPKTNRERFDIGAHIAKRSSP
ncbi:MAG TPA: PilN domain-containing protein [Stellaceae bacterium]|jgi:general secretion pathway protein L